MKRTHNASTMKLANMLEVIGIVRAGPVSRAGVARVTGLTRAAVTIIVDRLVRQGILVERGTGQNAQGKKPILLDIATDGLVFLGLDITRVDCSVAAVDLKGNAVRHARFDLTPEAPFEAVLPGIVSGIQSVLAGAGRLAGMGVSVPGPVDARKGLVRNPPNFPMLRGQNVPERLRSAVPCGIWLENNAVARALYEKSFGAGRGFRNFMAMVVDSGVGSGLVLDGKLHRGMGFAGEIGHTSIDGGGERCTCGNRGCLELYASIPRLLHGEPGHRAGAAAWESVVDGAMAGDERCRSLIAREARFLSQGIVNAANLLDLEAVILTGYVSYQPELLLGMVREAVQGMRITGGIHDLAILVSARREHAGPVAAAAIAMERFLAGETGWNPEE